MAMVGSSVLRKSVTVTHLKIAHPDIFVSVAPRWWSAAEKKMKEATMVFGSQISQIIYVPLLFVSSSCFVICLKCCLMISRPKKTHHVDEVVASHCCGAEGQVLALDVLHFQVQQNITCNQNI